MTEAEDLAHIDQDVLDEELLVTLEEIRKGIEENPEDKLEFLIAENEEDPESFVKNLMYSGYEPHPLQKKVHDTMQYYRFAVLVCHRRFGKTVLAINALCDSACRIDTTLRPNPRFGYLAPFLKQAKQIAWMYLKAFASNVKGSKKHESELYVEFPNGARITLYGGDNAEAMRGGYYDLLVLDEPADIKGHVWGDILRPALADRKGGAIFIGTPKGMNTFHERYTNAVEDPEWCTFLFRADETNLPWLDEDELKLLRRELSDNQYRQEMLCDWSASVDNVIIPLDLVSDAMQLVVPTESHLEGLPKVIGVDIARFGADKTCITKRWGHFMYPPVVMSHEDNMEVVGRLSRIADEFQPDAIFIDGGRGEGVIDRMTQLGYDVIEIDFGGKATNPHYANRRTEMYFNFLEWLNAGGVLPDNIELKAELSAPTYKMNASNKALMEPKDDTKETLGRSPDISDSAVLTVAQTVIPEGLRKRSQKTKVNRGGYHPHKRFK